MAYEQRSLRRQKVQYDDANDDNPLVYQLVDESGKVTPSSATITIYEPGNSTALVTAASMTVTGTLLTYSVDTTTEASWPIKNGYRAELVITAGGETVPAVMIFDVVRFVLRTNIGYDQLVALDDGIMGSSHNNDEDYSPLIEAVRDEIQAMVETKLLSAERANESWFVDSSLISMVHRYKCLAQIWHTKESYDRRDWYDEKASNLFEQVVNTVPLDTNQDGEETDTETGFDQERLIL